MRNRERETERQTEEERERERQTDEEKERQSIKREIIVLWNANFKDPYLGL